MCDIANGIARVPAPMMVLTRLMLLLIHDASPPRFWSLLDLLDRRLEISLVMACFLCWPELTCVLSQIHWSWIQQLNKKPSYLVAYVYAWCKIFQYSTV